MSSVRHLTRHALHRTLAVLSLPFRAIEPPGKKSRETERKRLVLVHSTKMAHRKYICADLMSAIPCGITLYF